MTISQIRQGDVLLVRVAEPQVKTATEEQGLLVPGERTGHAHRLPASVYEIPARRVGEHRIDRVLHVAQPTPITHEEHEHKTVPTGWWVPILQREYVPQSRPRNRSIVD